MLFWRPLVPLVSYLFSQPQPALAPVLHDFVADNILITGSSAVFPIIGRSIAVRPPVRANLEVCILGRNVPRILNSNLARDGREAVDSGGDGVVKRACVVGGVTQDVETVSLIIAFPQLLADVEGDAGGVDGYVITLDHATATR